MRRVFRRCVSGALAITLGAALYPQDAQALPAAPDPIYGVTASNKLVSFAQSTPGTLTTSKAISGLAAGENVVGIDFRPATGVLYAVTSASKIYTVDKISGGATFQKTISVSLSGTAFGVDFNPQADRLRVVSDTDQNLRINVDTGAATVDGPIAYAGGTPDPSVVASAYENPVGGATSTVLYGIDTAADTLVTQNANVGTVTAATGTLGVDAGTATGLDMTSDGSLLAAITLEGATTSGYYFIDKSTGAATSVGPIGGGEVVHDVAVPLPNQQRTFGVTASGHLITMEGVGLAHISHDVVITGLAVGETVLGIDVRPATGQLYALGSSSRVYSLDPSSGKATAVGPAFTPALTGTSFGFDFNPTVDRIRIVSDTGQNLRVHPVTGAVAFTDTTLAYAGGDADAAATPAIVGAGYTNSKVGASATDLFVLDAGTNQVAKQDPPNAGTLNSIGTALGFDVTTTTGFDISSDNKAVAVTTATGTSTLYSVDVAAGTSKALGSVPLEITDLAIADAPGYIFVASDGGVFSYGGARFAGSTGDLVLNRPIVGAANRTPGLGYWLVASDGGVFSFGGAEFYGSTGDKVLNKPVVGMASTPSGLGYWLVASDGGIFSYGDAQFWGSAGATPLNKPIVGMAATETGKGYWLFASDGGVFSYGDATFFGSAGGGPLNKPVVGGAAAPNGLGYYLVASDGGVFNYGAGAPFLGSAGNIRLNQPVVGLTVDPAGKGYWLSASDGGVFSYGPEFYGSTGNIRLNRPVVAIAAS